MGCFKRRKLPDDEDRDDVQESIPAPTKDTVSQSNTDSKSDQASEKNKLLDNNEANGSTPLPDPEEEMD